MTQYNSLNVKLSNFQPATNIATEGTLKLSSNMVGNSND